MAPFIIYTIYPVITARYIYLLPLENSGMDIAL